MPLLADGKPRLLCLCQLRQTVARSKAKQNPSLSLSTQYKVKQENCSNCDFYSQYNIVSCNIELLLNINKTTGLAPLFIVGKKTNLNVYKHTTRKCAAASFQVSPGVIKFNFLLSTSDQ